MKRDTTKCPICNAHLEAQITREVRDISLNDDCTVADWGHYCDDGGPQAGPVLYPIQCGQGHTYEEICAALATQKAARDHGDYSRFTFDSGILGTTHCVRLTNGSFFVIREDASHETLSLGVVECEGPIDESTAENPDWWFAQLNYDGVMPYMSCSQGAMVQLCQNLHLPKHAATTENKE